MTLRVNPVKGKPEGMANLAGRFINGLLSNL
jgi:hypothetical protein